MPEVKHGTEKLKEAVVLTIESGIKTAATFSDGFQPLPDLIALLGTGTAIQQMIKTNGRAIKDEFLDVDKEEGAELNKIVAEKFKVSSKKAERMTKAGVNMLWALIFFVDEINEPEDAKGLPT